MLKINALSVQHAATLLLWSYKGFHFAVLLIFRSQDSMVNENSFYGFIILLTFRSQDHCELFSMHFFSPVS